MPPTSDTPQRQIQGIECPKCGHGTYVGKSINMVHWMLRHRTCKNPRCRYTFETKEVIITPLPDRHAPGLFG